MSIPRCLAAFLLLVVVGLPAPAQGQVLPVSEFSVVDRVTSVACARYDTCALQLKSGELAVVSRTALMTLTGVTQKVTADGDHSAEIKAVHKANRTLRRRLKGKRVGFIAVPEGSSSSHFLRVKATPGIWFG